MSGTTSCPHCNTRFKIAEEQLEAHQGMVRCGHCLQAFDARPGYIPEQPSPQLELPILNEPAEPAGAPSADEPPAAEAVAEAVAETESAEAAEIKEAAVAPDGEIMPAEEIMSAGEAAAIGEAIPVGGAGIAEETEAAPPVVEEVTQIGSPEAAHDESQEAAQDNLLDFHAPATAEEAGAPPAAEEPLAPTLAEQVAIVHDEEVGDNEPPAEYRKWPWAVAASLLSLVLLAQATYFFRIDLAARLPALKPALTAYCNLLGCSVPLPQKADLMSIESSDLEADAEHENLINLNALLRNRATYPQAFPNLELTLNDTDDKPLARRIFKPKDYLPPQESEQAGLQPNHELVIKLHLGTADLRPTGYRLVLYYPQQ